MFGGRFVFLASTDTRQLFPICILYFRPCILIPQTTVISFHHHFHGHIFQDVVTDFPTKCDVEWVDAEDPLFLLYTSGSTGKPKVL